MRGSVPASDPGEEPTHETRQATFVAASLVLAAAFVPTQADAHGGHDGHGNTLTTIAGLDGPRGVDNLGHGKTLVTETDGTFSLVVERQHKDAKVVELGSVPAGFIAARDLGRTCTAPSTS